MRRFYVILAGLLVSFLVFPVLSFAQIKPKVTYLHKKTLRIPPQKLLIKKSPQIEFKRFTRSDFNFSSEQEFVTLNNGKELKVEEFLAELNDLEEKFNKLGYTLRDNKQQLIKIQFIYPKEQLELQKETLLKDLKTFSLPQKGILSKGLKLYLPPLQAPCEDKEIKGGQPTDFAPLNWEQNWEFPFGINYFGVKLITNMKIEGREDSLDVNSLFDARIFLFGEDIDVLKIEKSNDVFSATLINTNLFNVPLKSCQSKISVYDTFEWAAPVIIPIGPINLDGQFGFRGKLGINKVGWELNPTKESVQFTPDLSAEFFGELKANYKIVKAGVGGALILIEDEAPLKGSLALVQKPVQLQEQSQKRKFFNLSAYGEHKITLLSGKLYVFAEIDCYTLGSKRIVVEFYNDGGLSFNQTIFSIDKSIPAEKDHHVWLKIYNISGITPYTARNEKLEIEPREFDIIVEIGGNRYFKTVKDYNRDGRYGKATGEYESLIYEVPLLSFKKVPISIEVIERYKIGTLDFKNTLDFAPGIWKKIELCYDPKTRTFSGTKSGKENEEIRSVGDSNYWGERYHQIIFELTTKGGFKAAPAKAK